MPSLDLISLGYMFGRLAGAARFASPEIRRVASLATVAGAWRAYRRDAGAGDVGPAHQPSSDPSSVLMTDDPRRDAVVLWLAANGVPAIAEAATTIVRMVNATRGFDTDALALLNAAQDALAQVPARDPLTRACGMADLGLDHPLQGLTRAIAAVDGLITTADFAESHGHDAVIPLPSRSMRQYVAAEPAGCWALNLGLVARDVVPSVTGIIPRTTFRLDLEDTERSAALIDHSSHAALGAFSELERIESALVRGRDSLAGLSRNARAFEAWTLLTALGPTTRKQIARALGLSRAGADIQARALAAAGLVVLETGGLVTPALFGSYNSSSASLDHGLLGVAATDLDFAMAEVERIVSRVRKLNAD
jgi:hypothetical protein